MDITTRIQILKNWENKIFLPLVRQNFEGSILVVINARGYRVFVHYTVLNSADF